MNLTTLLDENPVILADGGMGTMLMQMGLEQGDTPELWNVDHPEKVKAIHQGYVDAGAQIILTNTFGGSLIRLESHGLGDRTTELNIAAAKLARSVADQATHPVLVAGSMGPCGQFLAPMGTLSYAEAVESFRQQAAALIEGGADVLWVETMSDLQEAQAAIEGCQQAAPDHAIVCTMTFDTHGRTMMGITPEKAAGELGQKALIAYGANCGNGTTEIETAIQKMHATHPDAILIAKSNVGMPRLENGKTVYDATPQDMAGYAIRIRDMGARIIGACCGSTPEHIQAMRQALSEDGAS